MWKEKTETCRLGKYSLVYAYTISNDRHRMEATFCMPWWRAGSIGTTATGSLQYRGGFSGQVQAKDCPVTSARQTNDKPTFWLSLEGLVTYLGYSCCSRYALYIYYEQWHRRRSKLHIRKVQKAIIRSLILRTRDTVFWDTMPSRLAQT